MRCMIYTSLLFPNRGEWQLLGTSFRMKKYCPYNIVKFIAIYNVANSLELANNLFSNLV